MATETAVFMCANDGARMELRSGRYSAFYACPAYASDKHCTNRISMKDADQIIRECEIPGKLYQIRRYQVYFDQRDGLKTYHVRRNE